MNFTRAAFIGIVLLPVLSFATDVHWKEGDAQPVRLHRGDTLTIDLDTVSDGGYSWVVKGKDRKLKLIKTDPRKAGSGPERADGQVIVGQPTVTTFSFKAVRRGNARLKLVYGREWEHKAEKVLKVRASIR